jgi:hypothetical protein
MHAKTRLKTHVDFLLGRNFKVLLLIPPTLTLDAFPEADRKLHAQITERTRALFESYRGTDPNLWVYDLDEVWDNAETMDGVHSNPELSLRIAMAINWTLSLNIY